MAIGDAGAAAGLTIYPSTQDIRLGYQNDNQRADDIAAVMARTTKLEGNAKTPYSVYRGTVIGATIGSGGGAHGVTNGVAIPAMPYARVARVDFGALVTAMTAPVDVILYIGGADTRRVRVSSANTSGTGFYEHQIPANAAESYQLTCNASAAWTVTSDTRFTWLDVAVSEIA